MWSVFEYVIVMFLRVGVSVSIKLWCMCCEPLRIDDFFESWFRFRGLVSIRRPYLPT